MKNYSLLTSPDTGTAHGWPRKVPVFAEHASKAQYSQLSRRLSTQAQIEPGAQLPPRSIPAKAGLSYSCIFISGLKGAKEENKMMMATGVTLPFTISILLHFKTISSTRKQKHQIQFCPRLLCPNDSHYSQPFKMMSKYSCNYIYKVPLL